MLIVTHQYNETLICYVYKSNSLRNFLHFTHQIKQKFKILHNYVLVPNLMAQGFLVLFYCYDYVMLFKKVYNCSQDNIRFHLIYIFK